MIVVNRYLTNCLSLITLVVGWTALLGYIFLITQYYVSLFCEFIKVSTHLRIEMYGKIPDGGKNPPGSIQIGELVIGVVEIVLPGVVAKSARYLIGM